MIGNLTDRRGRTRSGKRVSIKCQARKRPPTFAMARNLSLQFWAESRLQLGGTNRSLI